MLFFSSKHSRCSVGTLGPHFDVSSVISQSGRWRQIADGPEPNKRPAATQDQEGSPEQNPRQTAMGPVGHPGQTPETASGKPDAEFGWPRVAGLCATLVAGRPTHRSTVTDQYQTLHRCL